MEKGTTVALIVAVFAVGLVFGSFAGINEIALGRATRDVTYQAARTNGPVLSILPDIARPRDIMTGRVFPGNGGVLAGVKFYRVDDFGGRGALADECLSCFCQSGSVCFNEQQFTYIVPELESGFYTACITDAGSYQNACAMFQVT